MKDNHQQACLTNEASEENSTLSCMSNSIAETKIDSPMGISAALSEIMIPTEKNNTALVNEEKRMQLETQERTILTAERFNILACLALFRIRDDRTWEPFYASFEVYCQVRWRFTASRGTQMAGAGLVADILTNGNVLPRIENERQARELIPLIKIKTDDLSQLDPAQESAVRSQPMEEAAAMVVKAYQSACEAYPKEGAPSAAYIKKAVSVYLPPAVPKVRRTKKLPNHWAQSGPNIELRDEANRVVQQAIEKLDDSTGIEMLKYLCERTTQLLAIRTGTAA